MWPWTSHFIALWLSFHICEMAIVIPTSQSSLTIKEMICTVKHIIMHCIKTNYCRLFLRVDIWDGSLYHMKQFHTYLCSMKLWSQGNQQYWVLGFDGFLRGRPITYICKFTVCSIVFTVYIILIQLQSMK